MWGVAFITVSPLNMASNNYFISLSGHPHAASDFSAALRVPSDKTNKKTLYSKELGV